MPDDLLKRLYSSDPQVHQAALVDVLSSDDPVQGLLDLLVESASDDLSRPLTTDSSDALDARLMKLMDEGATEQELIAAIQQAHPFQDAFRGQRMVIIDLQRTLVGLGRPAWEQMMELARRSPAPYAAQVEDAMDDFAGVVTIEDVLQALTHENERIRQRACYLLAESEDASVLMGMVNALGQRRDAAALPTLHLLRESWEQKPQTIETSKLIDEINGAIRNIEKNSTPD
jgi:hypothetical protein